MPQTAHDAVMRISGIVIDVADLDLMAEFWTGLLGFPITRRENAWISLGPTFALQLVAEPKTVKNRIHLDLVADDWAEATARAAGLGAHPVGEIHENLWQVWRDPEGNEFCICRS